MSKIENAFEKASLDWIIEEVKSKDGELSAKLLAQVLNMANNTADYYKRGKNSKHWRAKTIRTSAVILAGIGILLPLVEGTGWPVLQDGLGYKLSVLMFALTGIITLFDKQYGYSSGWIRYAHAMLSIERETEQLLIQIPLILNKEEEELTVLTAIRDYAEECYDIAEKETKEWADEFRMGIQKLDKIIERGNRKK